jgi:D-sedoheptulose 7-phosphate isomerase
MSSTTTFEVRSQLIANITSEIRASILVKQAIMEDSSMLIQISRLAATCVQSLKGGGKIIFAGNGGSFADAQHLSAEFTSRFRIERPPLKSLALGTNNSAISAIGNDYGYKEVFSRELLGIANAQDIFIPISTSGNSLNIVSAVETGGSIGMTIVGLTGKSGGRIAELCECIKIPSMETARIQECHIMLGHILCGLVEEEMYK